MMRIITGRARGVKLSSLAGENTRPTSERAKEAIFSMLQFELRDAEVLDLFAGSGQMGLEALSRGARHAFFCDRAKDAVEVIRANTLKTKLAPFCDVVCMDYSAALRDLRRRKVGFDLVFLDPPYALGLIPDALRLLTEYGLLNDNARVICESAADADVFSGDTALEAEFEVLRCTRYGVAHVTLLQKKDKRGEEGIV